MKFFILLSLFVIFCNAAPAWAGNWTKADTGREIAFEALNGLDWAQTHWAIKHNFTECDPLIGCNASAGKINTMMLSAAIIHPLISYLLPPKYRVVFQWTSIAVKIGTISWNFSMGTQF